MRVVHLKALAKEHGLRRYSKMRKCELITLLRNNLEATFALQHCPQYPTRPRPPPPPTLQHPQSVRFRPDRPRQPAAGGKASTIG